MGCTASAPVMSSELLVWEIPAIQLFYLRTWLEGKQSAAMKRHNDLDSLLRRPTKVEAGQSESTAWVYNFCETPCNAVILRYAPANSTDGPICDEMKCMTINFCTMPSSLLAIPVPQHAKTVLLGSFANGPWMEVRKSQREEERSSPPRPDKHSFRPASPQH